MKQLVLLFTFLLITLSIQSQNEFVIKGQIVDIADGTSIELAKKNLDRSQTQLDICTIQNGLFTLKGTTHNFSESVLITLYKNEQPYFSREIWIGKGTTTIVGKNKYASLWDVQNDSGDQQEANKYIVACYDNLLKQERHIEFVTELFAKMKDPNASQEEIQESKLAFDSIRNLAAPITQQILEKEIEIMQQSEVSTIWMNKLEQLTGHIGVNEAFRDVVVTLYERLNDEQKNTPIGQNLATVLYPPVFIGKEVIDKVLEDTNGESRQLADYRGKYVLVDFWASWCSPCIMAIPELRKLDDKYEDRLTIVGVNLDSKDEQWRDALLRYPTNWVNLRDKEGFGGGLHRMYNGDSIPMYILISPEGIVVDIWGGYRENSLHEKIDLYIK